MFTLAINVKIRPPPGKYPLMVGAKSIIILAETTPPQIFSQKSDFKIQCFSPFLTAIPPQSLHAAIGSRNTILRQEMDRKSYAQFWTRWV